MITPNNESSEIDIKRRCRRGLKKNKRNIFTGDFFRIVAVNCAGITSKMESFNKMLFDRKPSVWFLQETKRKINDSKMKASNLINYQVLN